LGNSWIEDFIRASRQMKTTFDVIFSLKAGHKKLMQLTVIRKLINAARQMQKDAEVVKEEGTLAAETYEKAMEHLKHNLTEAKEQFNAYYNTFDQVVSVEKSSVSILLMDTKASLNLLRADLDDRVVQSKAKFHQLKQKLQADLGKLKSDETKLKNSLDTLDESSSKKDADAVRQLNLDMDHANTCISKAQTALADAKKKLTIKSAKPRGRSCSSGDMHRWEREVQSAEHNLNSVS